MDVDDQLKVRASFWTVVALLTPEQIEGVYIAKYVDFLKRKKAGNGSLTLGLSCALFAECAGFAAERKQTLQDKAALLAESGHF